MGCTGWSYEGWGGTFYPKNLQSSDFLKYYSAVFNTTEINSTFYRIPNRITTRKWFLSTPKNFTFTAKFPSKITHDHRLKNVKSHVMDFLSSLLPLKSKMTSLVLQLPPSLSFEEAKPRLLELLSSLPNYYTYPIEGRHDSWFTDEAIDFLTEKNLCLVWNEIEGISNPTPITSDFVYLRLIGDRTIPESDFGKVVRDKKNTIKNWARKLDEVKNRVSLGIAMLNNHLEGFAPSSANTLRLFLGLDEVNWYNKEQSRLADFSQDLPKT